jgi:hypothetical protein
MTTPTEARARSQVAAFFQGSPRRAAALALFDRGTVEAKVPDPAIRAALVLLVGTAGEPAIQHFLRSPSYVSPRFGGLGVQQLGRASIRYSDRKIEIILNARHMAEHPALLSSTLLHEILHHDPAVAGYPEEIILNWVSAVVHLQLVARHPALARSRTELSRYLNDSVLTIVNSRPRGSPRIAILVPRGAGVAPGSPKDAPDFWTFVHRVYEQNPTSSAQVAPAPPAFRAIVQALLARGAAPAKPQYSRKTAALFSKMNDTWLSPVDRLRVSVLLGLVSVEEIVRYTGLTRSKAIATFRLGPILAARG